MSDPRYVFMQHWHWDMGAVSTGGFTHSGQRPRFINDLLERRENSWVKSANHFIYQVEEKEK